MADVKIARGDVWIGAMVTHATFVVGKFAIGMYLGRASFGSAHGAAGSLVDILVWVYYSAQILLFGAELTNVHANRADSWLEPVRGAVKITSKERAQQGMPRSA